MCIYGSGHPDLNMLPAMTSQQAISGNHKRIAKQNAVSHSGRHLASSTIGSMNGLMNGARWYQNSAKHNDTFGSVLFWVMTGMCHTVIGDVQYGKIRVNMEYYVYMVLANPRNTPSQGCVIRSLGTFNTEK